MFDDKLTELDSNNTSTLTNELTTQNTYEVLCCDRLSRAAGPHHHARQSVLHVLEAVSQGQDGHDLTGHCNVKPSLECEKRKITCNITQDSSFSSSFIHLLAES